MENVFKGRSIIEETSLFLDEWVYLFEKTKELKIAMTENNHEVMDSFRVDNRDMGA